MQARVSSITSICHRWLARARLPPPTLRASTLWPMPGKCLRTAATRQSMLGHDTNRTSKHAARIPVASSHGTGHTAHGIRHTAYGTRHSSNMVSTARIQLYQPISTVGTSVHTDVLRYKIFSTLTSFLNLTLAPCSISMRTVASLPLPAAHCRAVNPLYNRPTQNMHEELGYNKFSANRQRGHTTASMNSQSGVDRSSRTVE
jgi:hypothetical protein